MGVGGDARRGGGAARAGGECPRSALRCVVSTPFPELCGDCGDCGRRQAAAGGARGLGGGQPALGRPAPNATQTRRDGFVALLQVAITAITREVVGRLGDPRREAAFSRQHLANLVRNLDLTSAAPRPSSRRPHLADLIGRSHSSHAIPCPPFSSPAPAAAVGAGGHRAPPRGAGPARLRRRPQPPRRHLQPPGAGQHDLCDCQAQLLRRPAHGHLCRRGGGPHRGVFAAKPGEP